MFEYYILIDSYYISFSIPGQPVHPLNLLLSYGNQITYDLNDSDLDQLSQSCHHLHRDQLLKDAHFLEQNAQLFWLGMLNLSLMHGQKHY